jgi:uncharacterized DUF497 family protein
VYTLSVYTFDVDEQLSGFDWDEYNIAHIAEHGVSPQEVEYVATHQHLRFPATTKGQESRWKLFGKTLDGRFLVVVFTIRGGRFRTVTAYTMNQLERRRYGSELEG